MINWCYKAPTIVRFREDSNVFGYIIGSLTLQLQDINAVNQIHDLPVAWQ